MPHINDTPTVIEMEARREDVSLRGRFNSHQGMTLSHMVLMEHSLNVIRNNNIFNISSSVKQGSK